MHARQQRVGARGDLRGLAALRGDRPGVNIDRRGRRRGITLGRRQRLQSGVLADDASSERPGLASQRVGAVMGGRRGSRHGDRVPHRHRPGRHDGRRRQRRGGHGLPRARRSDHELCRDHVLGSARGDEDGRLWCAGPPPQPEGADLRGRRHLGAVPRRPDGRGLSPAPYGGAAQADSQIPRRSSTARSMRHSSTTRLRSRPSTRWATRT